MIDTIILLTEPAVEEALTDALRRYNPRLTICPANSREQLAAIDPKLVRRARLIGFVTPVVVPAPMLNALGFGAYNFHPGPPNYPGWVPAHFAIYDQAGMYGATAHRTAEQVDAGGIVDVELFMIPPGTDVARLQEMAFTRLAWLFWRLAPVLATQREPLVELPIAWTGTRSTRQTYTAMCDMPADISKEELERRIEVFGDGDYGVDLTVTLHGRKFRYVPPEENTVDCAYNAPAVKAA
jgi:methionyl-tRNA formyltransferase